MQTAGDSLGSIPASLGQADTRLLEREFTIADPGAISDLAQELPPGEPPPTILFKYDTKASGRPALRCAHCRGARHWKGYVVQLSDGRSALIAERQCGRDAFGFKWESVEAQFNLERDRQLDLRRLLLVQPLLDPLIAELKVAIDSRALWGHAAYLTEVRTRFGRFGQALAKMARQGGQLEATRWVRNRAKEEERVRKLKPELIDNVEHALEIAYRDRARKILDRFIEENCKVEEPAPLLVGQCQGWQTLTSRGAPHALLKSAAAALEGVASSVRSSGAPNKLGPLLRSVSDACEEITQALDIARDLERFLGGDNLDQIAKWAAMDGSLRFSFEVEGSALVDRITGNRLALDSAWSVPPLPALALMKAALRGPATG